MQVIGPIWGVSLFEQNVKLPDGVYDVMASATNVAGVIGEDPTVDELVIDTEPPPVPTVDLLLTNNIQPTLTGSFDGSSQLTVTVIERTFVLGVNEQLAADGNNWQLDLSQLSPPFVDGSYSIEATVLMHWAIAAPISPVKSL